MDQTPVLTAFLASLKTKPRLVFMETPQAARSTPVGWLELAARLPSREAFTAMMRTAAAPGF